LTRIYQRHFLIHLDGRKKNTTRLNNNSGLRSNGQTIVAPL
jgi:hypothetical protein